MPNSCDEHDLFFLEARDGLLESLSIRAPFIDFPGTGKPQESTASVWIDSKFEGYRLFFNRMGWFHIGNNNNKHAKKMNDHHRRQEEKSEWGGLITSWTVARPEEIEKTKQKSASQFVLSVVMIRGEDGGHRDEWKCLFQWICLRPLRMDPWNSQNACENAHRKQLQPHESKWKFGFVLSFPALVQHPGRPPICEISDSFFQSFWAWIRFWEGRAGLYTEGGFSPQIQ